MRIIFGLILISIVPLIQSQRYSDYEGRAQYEENRYNRHRRGVQDNYLDDYEDEPLRHIRSYSAPSSKSTANHARAKAKKNINSRGIEDTIENAAIGAVGLVSTKAKQVIVLIKCVMRCGYLMIKKMSLEFCNRLFPCLYDCFIGQDYLEPDFQAQLDKSGGAATWPEGVGLQNVLGIFQCLYHCITDRRIKNWESFVFSLYCFADTCICFNLFGVGGGSSSATDAKS